MKYLAWIFSGLLLAAALHVATMPAADRAGILRITPASPADMPVPVAAPVAVMSANVSTPANERPTASTAAAVEAPTAVSPADTRVFPRSRLPADPDRANDLDQPPEGLMIPVKGVMLSQLSPTFEDARSEGRVHEALDIMAPVGTPVLAVADGHVEKLFDSELGGLTIYQFDPDACHAYYYAHLDSYAPGLAEQQLVRRGQVIGFVGSTGNADPAAPHLHFAIFVLGPEKRWWEGTPIDPYPLFVPPH